MANLCSPRQTTTTKFTQTYKHWNGMYKKCVAKVIILCSVQYKGIGILLSKQKNALKDDEQISMPNISIKYFENS